MFNNKSVEIRDIIQYSNFNFNPQYFAKKYNTEVLLITNTINKKNLYEWLYWHLNIIKFNHAIVIDNSELDLSSVTDRFNNKITYKKMVGKLSQSEIYTKYVNNSDSCWVLPIDDDEFLYISDNYDNNINYYLNDLNFQYTFYKHSFNWHMMFSNCIINNTNESYITAYPYTYLKTDVPIELDCFNLCKTIVNTNIKHLYVSDNADSKYIPYENINLNKFSENIISHIFNLNNDIIGTVHNPISKSADNIFEHSYNLETNQVILGLFNNYNLDINSDAYICHYKYRSRTDWLHKQKHQFVDSLEKHIKNNYQISMLDNIYNIVISNLTIQNKIIELYNKYNINM